MQGMDAKYGWMSTVGTLIPYKAGVYDG